MNREEQKARKELLNYKKDQFLQYVGACAGSRNHKIPKVKFWKFKDINHFTKSERAHIHIEQNLICIPETELEIMNDDEIEETAFHEVNHLFEIEHGSKHTALIEKDKVILWKPPLGEGIRLITEDEKKIRFEGSKRKESKDRCFVHFCNKKGTTFQCPYCNKYFCGEHKNPREPDSKLAGEETHPCFGYQSYMYVQRKKEDNKYKSTLGKMFGKGHIVEVRDEYPNESYETKKEDFGKNISSKELRKITSKNFSKKDFSKISKAEEEKEEDLRTLALNSVKRDKPAPYKKIETKKYLIIILIIALLVIGYIWYNHITKTRAEAERIANLPKCNDGTLYDTCSTNKPYFCYDGELLKKAATCGCPVGYKIDFQDCKLA